MTESGIDAWIIALATAIGVMVSYITFHYQRKQTRLNTLHQTFALLNENKHRIARQIVYAKYNNEMDDYSIELMDMKGVPNERVVAECQAMVRADFDQMGALLKNKHIEEGAFLDAYWNTVLICWKALEENIERQRKSRKNPSYMKNFELLKERAKDYWFRKHPEVPSLPFFDYNNL